MRMEIVEAVLHKIGAVSETEVTKTTLRMLGKDALRPDVRRRLCGPSRFAFFFGRWPPAVTPTPWACCDLHFRPNFTRFPIKLLILLDTTHFCSHNISLNFILDVDVGSGFSPNQRRQIHT
jgi:hypothetical protein